MNPDWMLAWSTDLPGRVKGLGPSGGLNESELLDCLGHLIPRNVRCLLTFCLFVPEEEDEAEEDIVTWRVFFKYSWDDC